MHIFRSNLKNEHAHFSHFFWWTAKISGTSEIRLLHTPHHHQPKTCFTRFCIGGNLVLTLYIVTCFNVFLHVPAKSCYFKKQVNSCSQSWFMAGSRGLDFTFFFWIWAGEIGPPHPEVTFLNPHHHHQPHWRNDQNCNFWGLLSSLCRCVCVRGKW